MTDLLERADRGRTGDLVNARPLLALDVDGVLNVIETRRAHDPSLVSHAVTVVTPWSGGRTVTVTLRVNPKHGRLLLDLATELDADLAWATTWNDLANVHVAPLVGLPELPVITVPMPPHRRKPWDAHWKRDAILAYAGDRPLAWLDDDLTDADDMWARDRRTTGSPTLLIGVDPAEGLRREHLNLVRRWHELG